MIWIRRPVVTCGFAVAFFAAALFAGVADLDAQLSNPSAADFGMGGNTTAIAREMAAISVNPAGLGMPGSGFSLSLLPVQLRTGLAPITLADLVEMQGAVVPAATKEQWLADITQAGGQTGSFGVDVSGLALTIGSIGLQVSTTAAGRMDAGPGVVEALLFGNAGRLGAPADISFANSETTGYAVSTAAIGTGFAVPMPSGRIAFGATVKYSMGHGVLIARDMASVIASDPLSVSVDYPAIHTDENADDVRNGSGVGVDLGVQMATGSLSFGASVKNVMNNFAWDRTRLVYRPTTVRVEQSSSVTDFDAQSIAAAPDVLLEALDRMTFGRVVSVGAALGLGSRFTVSGDVRRRIGDGIETDPREHMGVGARLELPIIHLQGGVSKITDAMQYSAGASLVLGPVNLGVSGAVQRGEVLDATAAMVTLSFGGH